MSETGREQTTDTIHDNRSARRKRKIPVCVPKFDKDPASCTIIFVLQIILTWFAVAHPIAFLIARIENFVLLASVRDVDGSSILQATINSIIRDRRSTNRKITHLSVLLGVDYGLILRIGKQFAGTIVLGVVLIDRWLDSWKQIHL